MDSDLVFEFLNITLSLHLHLAISLTLSPISPFCFFLKGFWSSRQKCQWSTCCLTFWQSEVERCHGMRAGLYLSPLLLDSWAKLGVKWAWCLAYKSIEKHSYIQAIAIRNLFQLFDNSKQLTRNEITLSLYKHI